MRYRVLSDSDGAPWPRHVEPVAPTNDTPGSLGAPSWTARSPSTPLRPQQMRGRSSRGARQPLLKSHQCEGHNRDRIARERMPGCPHVPGEQTDEKQSGKGRFSRVVPCVGPKPPASDTRDGSRDNNTTQQTIFAVDQSSSRTVAAPRARPRNGTVRGNRPSQNRSYP